MPREIGINIRYQNVLIMLIAGLLVFILAWFNFTLLTISQNQVNVKKLIYQWQTGASKDIFKKQFFIEFISIGFIGFIAGISASILLIKPFNNLLGIQLFENKELYIYSTVAVLLILIFSSLATSRFATRRLYRHLHSMYFASQQSYKPASSSRNLFIRVVIIVEFAITFILITNLLTINQQLKFSIQNQIGSTDLQTVQIPDLPRHVIDRYDLFRDELLKYPGMDVTAMMEEPGGSAMDAFKYSVEGFSKTDDRLFVFPVDENFIRFYKLEISAGEDFPTKYDRSDTTEYYILNETAAKLLDDDYSNIIGRELRIEFEHEGFIYPGNITGIIKDFHLSDMDMEINPMVIFPEYTWLYCFSVRITGDMQEGISLMKNTWNELFPNYPFRYYFTSEMYQELYNTELTEIRVLIIFSIVSLLIAGMGLFALSGFFMSQKIPSAAIRKIHGAQIKHILVPELMHHLFLAIIAMAVALPISIMAIRHWQMNMVYRADIQYWIFPAIGLFMILFAWFSVLYHAIKLSRLNPVDALKRD